MTAIKLHYSLREGNIARNIEWTGGKEPGLLFRVTEMVGEMGEIADLLIRRFPNTMTGTGSWLSDLADEIADGLICIDLLGMDLGFTFEEVPSPTFLPTHSDALTAAFLMLHSGQVANIAKKIERERRGWPGSRARVESLEKPLRDLWEGLGVLAYRYSFDPAEAVVSKFNTTSANVGLNTRIGKAF